MQSGMTIKCTSVMKGSSRITTIIHSTWSKIKSQSINMVKTRFIHLTQLKRMRSKRVITITTTTFN